MKKKIVLVCSFCLLICHAARSQEQMVVIANGQKLVQQRKYFLKPQDKISVIIPLSSIQAGTAAIDSITAETCFMSNDQHQQQQPNQEKGNIWDRLGALLQRKHERQYSIIAPGKNPKMIEVDFIPEQFSACDGQSFWLRIYVKKEYRNQFKAIPGFKPELEFSWSK